MDIRSRNSFDIKVNGQMNSYMCSLRNQEDIEWGVQQTGENLSFKGKDLCCGC